MMSNRHTRAFPAYVIVILTCASAHGDGWDFPPGPIGDQHGWPKGLIEVVNSGDRVHGYGVNWEAVFFYSGDTNALNAFIQLWGRLEKTELLLVLNTGPKNAWSPWDEEERDAPVDWTIYTSQSPGPLYNKGLDVPRENDNDIFYTRIDVWLGRNVGLEGLKIPKNVEVRSTRAIERFVQSHSAR